MKHIYTSKMQFRPDIDGLRAIAVLSVVGFHAFPDWVRGGFSGVDIFFVISGYLISSIILGDLNKNEFSFIEFYVRRIKRIFPALLVVMLLSIVFGWSSLFVDEYKQLGKHAFGGSVFIENFFLLYESGYFDNAIDTKPFMHLWSLGVEEQFYLIWPLVLFLVAKFRFNYLTVTVLLLTASFLFNVQEINSNPVLVFFSPITRFWEFLIGAIPAWFLIFKSNLFKRFVDGINKLLCLLLFHDPGSCKIDLFKNIFSLLGFLFVFSSFLLLNKSLQFPGYYALLPTLGAVFIISSGAGSYLNNYLLSNKLMVFIGSISYPLYLWHWPLLSFARIVVGEEPSRNIRIAAVLLSFVAAWLTYRFIECPIRYNVSNFSKLDKLKPAILILSMFFITSISILIYYNDGFPSRYSIHFNERSVRKWGLEGSGVEDCSQLFPDIKSTFCATTPNPSVAIIGDSHAGALFQGFLNNSVNKDYQQVIIMGAGGCQATHIAEKCDKQLTLSMKRLQELNSVHTVIVAGYYWFLADDPVSTKQYLNGFIDTIEQLQKMNKRVVYVIDNPSFNDPIDACETKVLWIRDRFSIKPELCRNPNKTDLRNQDLYLKFVDTLKSNTSGVIFVDAKQSLCQYDICPLFKDDKLLYTDWNHLSKYGSKLVADDIIRIIN